MFRPLPWGAVQLWFPSNKLLNHCGESFLLLAQRTHPSWLHNAASPHPAFPRGWKTQKHFSTTAFVRFLLITENHHLHLSVPKWHKMKEKLSFMKAPYSHFSTLISSRCIFSEENPLWVGLNLLEVKWENFNISLDWLKRGEKKTLGKSY